MEFVDGVNLVRCPRPASLAARSHGHRAAGVRGASICPRPRHRASRHQTRKRARGQNRSR
jgi:hypothetical protein